MLIMQPLLEEESECPKCHENVYQQGINTVARDLVIQV